MRLKMAGLAVLIALALAACGSHNATNQAQILEQKQQGIDSYNLDINQPVPGFDHSQLRQEAIDIETAQANGVQTTTFFMPNGDASGQPQGSCPSIGAPVAADTQLTNPLQVEKDNVAPIYNGGGNVAIGQEDPTGVYTGPSTGTYVMCVSPSGQTYAEYWEGPVRVVFGPAVWNAATNSPQLVGQPSSAFADIKTTRK